MAVAGRPAPIKLALSDEYNNASSPEAGWRVVLAISNFTPLRAVVCLEESIFRRERGRVQTLKRLLLR
jgi:hypothetical protein